MVSRCFQVHTTQKVGGHEEFAVLSYLEPDPSWQTTYHDSGDPKKYFDITCQLGPKMFSRTSISNFCPLTMDQCQTWWPPAEYSWRPLFNAAKFGWRPLLECRAVTLSRRETRWNLLGCPKRPNGSQLLAGQSSPYCEDMWGDILLFNKFFSDCRYMTYLRRYSPTKLCDGAQMANFWRFFWVLHFQWAACSTCHFTPAF